MEESRSVPVMLIDYAGAIPEDLPFFCLSVPEKLKVNNVSDIQKIEDETKGSFDELVKGIC